MIFILCPELEREVAARFLDALQPLEQAGKFGALRLQMTPGFAPRKSNLTALANEKKTGRFPEDRRLKTLTGLSAISYALLVISICFPALPVIAALTADEPTFLRTGWRGMEITQPAFFRGPCNGSMPRLTFPPG